MINREQAKMARNSASDDFLDKKAGVFSNDKPLVAAAAKFKLDFAAAKVSAAAATVDNTGFSADKLTAKKALSLDLSILCSGAIVRFEELGKHSLANSVHDAESYYLNVADAVCTARAQEAHDILFKNLADLTPDYVVAKDLTDLQTLITDFDAMQGSTASVNQASPALTKQFKSDLKVTDVDIKKIQKLGKKYKKLNSLFYDGLMGVTEIPAVNVHHTTVEYEIYDSVTGDPLEDVDGTLTKSKEMPKSDAAGFMQFDNVGGGEATSTFKKVGYKDHTIKVHIISGKDNVFKVFMEKL